MHTNILGGLRAGHTTCRQVPLANHAHSVRTSSGQLTLIAADHPMAGTGCGCQMSNGPFRVSFSLLFLVELEQGVATLVLDTFFRLLFRQRCAFLHPTPPHAMDPEIPSHTSFKKRSKCQQAARIHMGWLKGVGGCGGRREPASEGPAAGQGWVSLRAGGGGGGGRSDSELHSEFGDNPT